MSQQAKVYFSDLRCKPGVNLLQKLQKLIRAAGMEQIDFQRKLVAIKMHFGEPGNLAFLRPNYAKAVADEVKRLGNIILARGVVIRKGETLRELYDERVPLYEKYADYTIDCEGHGVEDTVHAVCALVKKLGM